MIICTTDSVPGATIERPLGLVNARVVVGANVIADIFASFSDFFGGRSGAYQNQLDKMHQALMRELEEAARARGANAIVGVRIDNDSISGKNVSMFMASAYGTAVRTMETVGGDLQTQPNVDLRDAASNVSAILKFARIKTEGGYVQPGETKWRSIPEWADAVLAETEPLVSRIIDRIRSFGDNLRAGQLVGMIMLASRRPDRVEEGLQLLAGTSDVPTSHQLLAEWVGPYWPIAAGALATWMRESGHDLACVKIIAEGKDPPFTRRDKAGLQKLLETLNAITWGDADFMPKRKWRCPCGENKNPREAEACVRCNLRTRAMVTWSEGDRSLVHRAIDRVKHIVAMLELLDTSAG